MDGGDDGGRISSLFWVLITGVFPFIPGGSKNTSPKRLSPAKVIIWLLASTFMLTEWLDDSRLIQGSRLVADGGGGGSGHITTTSCTGLCVDGDALSSRAGSLFDETVPVVPVSRKVFWTVGEEVPLSAKKWNVDFSAILTELQHRKILPFYFILGLSSDPSNSAG